MKSKSADTIKQTDIDIFDLELIKNLRTVREKLGLDPVEVARKLGVSRQRFQNYEKGARKLPIKFLVDLLKIYEISLEEILPYSNLKASNIDYKDEAAFYKKIAIRLNDINKKQTKIFQMALSSLSSLTEPLVSNLEKIKKFSEINKNLHSISDKEADLILPVNDESVNKLDSTNAKQLTDELERSLIKLQKKLNID